MTGSIELARTGCIVCGRSDSRPLFSFSPPDLEGEFDLELCPHCDCAFVNPHPTQSAINLFFADERIYRSTKDPEGRPRSLLLERDVKRPEFSEYVRRLKRMTPRGKALDVGCGPGLFLEMLGSGYDRLGLDINPLAVSWSQDNLDFEVRLADAQEVEFDQRSMDLVSIMQTLDHFERPGRFLQKTAGWLKTGGTLFLSALINYRSAAARVFKKDFRLLHPFHLAYFKPAAIRKILSRLGFRIERIEYPYFKTQYFSWKEAPLVAGKFLRRLAASPVPGRRLLSPPFYGNTMNVYAVKTERA